MTTARTIELLSAYSLQLAALLGIGLISPVVLRFRGPVSLLRYHNALLLLALLLPVGALLPTLRDALRSADAMVLVGLEPLGLEPLVITVSESSPWWSWGSAALIAIGFGFAARVVWLAAGAGALRRARRAGQPFELSPEQAEWRARLCPRARLLASPRAEVPVTYGWRRPIILLPMHFSDLGQRARDGIVCHELLHCQRRDWLWVLLAESVRALLWFHPAIWLLLDRIALYREQVVDRQVVALTGQRRAYLDALVDVAASGRRAAMPAPLFIGPKHLRRRVRELLKEIKMTRTRTVATMFLCAGLAGGAFLLAVSGVPLAAAAAEVLAPSQERAEQEPIHVAGDVVKPVFLAGDQPSYTAMAREARIQGVVIVQTVIDARGDVISVEVLKGLSMGLTEAAVAAVKTWKFKPATLDGEPVAVRFNLTVNFQLDETAGSGRIGAPGPKGVSSVPSVPAAVAAERPAPSQEREEQKPIYVTGDVVKPERLSGEQPIYPEAARKARIQGVVIVQAVIDARGDVIGVEVLKGLSMGLTEAAVAAVKTWKFKPAMLNGTPVAVRFNMTVNFQLDETVGSQRIGKPGALVVPSVPLAAAAAERPAPSQEREEQEPIYVTGDVVRPEILSRTMPVYPEAAREARIQGVVVLQAVIDTEGNVTDVEVLERAPMGLSEAVTAAVRTWKFKPAMLDGEPVAVIFNLTMNLRLD